MSIDASSVDPFSLPSLPVSRRLSLPDCPAVYFALSGDDEILYVGRSISLLKRWKGTHERKGALEESNRGRVAWLVIENVEALAEIEEAFIERFRPPLNGSPIHREPEVWEVWEYQPEDSGELCGPDLDAELNAQIDRLNG